MLQKPVKFSVPFEEEHPVQAWYAARLALNVAALDVEQGGKLSLFQICIANCL